MEEADAAELDLEGVAAVVVAAGELALEEAPGRDLGVVGAADPVLEVVAEDLCREKERGKNKFRPVAKFERLNHRLHREFTVAHLSS